MSKTKPSLLKTLIIYYGVIQFIHLFALIYSAWLYRYRGTLSELAPSPSGGWSIQATYFLIGLGAIDALVAILSIGFTVGYLYNASWSISLGRTCLTASLFSALIFALGTVPTGAWNQNPLPYLIMVVLFMPVFALFLLLPNWKQYN